MSTEITIGGESRPVADFSAFKALLAMELVSEAQARFKDVLKAGADFKRAYEAENYVEMTRAEARRHFRPRALYEDVPLTTPGGELVHEDGVPLLRQQPLLRDGAPVLGPDPLGHLTDEDWTADGNRMRVSESPARNLITAAMVEAGFRLARAEVLRLLALTMATNADLERWEDEGGTPVIVRELDEEAKRLVRRASLAELVQAVIATVEACREQLAGPFGDLQAALNRLRKATPDEVPERVPEPMRMETEEPSSGASSEPPTSSTVSPDGTAGERETSSTESRSGSSPVSVSA